MLPEASSGYMINIFNPLKTYRHGPAKKLEKRLKTIPQEARGSSALSMITVTNQEVRLMKKKSSALSTMKTTSNGRSFLRLSCGRFSSQDWSLLLQLEEMNPLLIS